MFSFLYDGALGEMIAPRSPSPSMDRDRKVVSEGESCVFFDLPGAFPDEGGMQVAELVMMARFVYFKRRRIKAWLESPRTVVALQADSMLYEPSPGGEAGGEEEKKIPEAVAGSPARTASASPSSAIYPAEPGMEITRRMLARLERIVKVVVDTGGSGGDLELQVALLDAALAGDLRSLLSAYNRHVRLYTTQAEKTVWPRANLCHMEKEFASGMIPPPTPCEYVDSRCAASFMVGPDGAVSGELEDRDAWLGHGYFYYQRPAGSGGAGIVNTGAGGDANQNFDVLEEKYVRLRKASVMCADYPLLRRDFGDTLAGMSDEEINAWLLDSAAYISSGQVQRLADGGDHHDLLGITEPAGGNALDDVVDTARQKMGLRMRAGGRAATFFAGDRYGFSLKDGSFKADLIDVKGCGTHKDVACKKLSHTGLLGKTDALRGLAVQKLVQRICELEGQQDHWSTVQFYAILDTGLKYGDGVADPATGVAGERCVLALRQAQSRLTSVYGSFGDFAAGGGNLLLAGDVEGLIKTGNGRRVRQALERYGLSAEIALSYLVDHARGRGHEEHLDDFSSMWNLQSDAAVKHFMDFSNYYAFPSPYLAKEWHMAKQTIVTGYVLDNNATEYRLDTILGLKLAGQPLLPEGSKPEVQGPGLPALRELLFGTSDQMEAYDRFRAEWVRISQDPVHRGAAAMITADGSMRGDTKDPAVTAEGMIVRSTRTKACQNWFMELDVMTGPIWTWAERWRLGDALLEQIEAWLPTVAPPAQPGAYDAVAAAAVALAAPVPAAPAAVSSDGGEEAAAATEEGVGIVGKASAVAAAPPAEAAPATEAASAAGVVSAEAAPQAATETTPAAPSG